MRLDRTTPIRSFFRPLHPLTIAMELGMAFMLTSPVMPPGYRMAGYLFALLALISIACLLISAVVQLLRYTRR